MKLIINYSKKTGKIKQAFNKAFPYLRIEFFNMPHDPGQPSAMKNLVKDNIYLGEINPLLTEGAISIEPEDIVGNIEQLFQEKFGISVQVFRKQKNVWIETTRTDKLSLAEQNEKGKLSTAPPEDIVVGDRYLEDGQY